MKKRQRKSARSIQPLVKFLRGLAAVQESALEAARLQHGLSRTASLEAKLQRTDKVAAAALSLVDGCIEILERLAPMLPSHTLTEHGHRMMALINAKKVIPQNELDAVDAVRREIAHQYPKKMALHAAIANRLNMPERRVRTAIEKLDKK